MIWVVWGIGIIVSIAEIALALKGRPSYTAFIWPLLWAWANHATLKRRSF